MGSLKVRLHVSRVDRESHRLEWSRPGSRETSRQQIGSIEQHDTLAQDTWVYETLRQSWSDPGILAFRSIDSVNASPNHEHGVEAATILD